MLYSYIGDISVHFNFTYVPLSFPNTAGFGEAAMSSLTTVDAFWRASPFMFLRGTVQTYTLSLTPFLCMSVFPTVVAKKWVWYVLLDWVPDIVKLEL